MAAGAGLPRRRVDEVLELVQLTEHANRRVGGFSMGMLQRLALAGALLGDPGVLILDEPVNGLDPPGILWVRDLLRRLAEEGRALLVSSHLLSELAEVAHRVVIIDRGRLIVDTTLDDLLAQQSHVVQLRCATPAPLVQALRARHIKVVAEGDALLIEGISAREAGETAAAVGAGPVYWLTERTSSFEDVYFRLAGPSSITPAEDLAVAP
jgi:ABC-2 type transport system ATP-binding protein